MNTRIKSPIYIDSTTPKEYYENRNNWVALTDRETGLITCYASTTEDDNEHTLLVTPEYYYLLNALNKKGVVL